MDVAVGRYVLQIGGPCGSLIREASRGERAHVRPRATPILVRPRLIRGFVGRRTELDAVLSALDAGLPVEISGEPGIGKTALLRQLAHHPRAASFVDGIIYAAARHQPLVDLQQVIFDAFYESDGFSKPTDAEIRRGLQDKRALILLDDVHLTQNELEQLLDSVPRSAFVAATRQRCLWGEARSLTLRGLQVEDAVSLLERAIERSVSITERPQAMSLCEAIAGHPLRIAQAAALLRDRGLSFDALAQSITPKSLLAELMASIDDRQRRALLALTALPGVPLTAQHVSGIAEVTDIEAALVALARRGLVVTSGPLYQLADGVADKLRRTEDFKPWVNRAITYFLAWCERYRRTPEALLEESEALLRVQEQAVEVRRRGEAIELGLLIEQALIANGRWGAWALTLERRFSAARALADAAAEASTLHETGTRAVCVGETSLARVTLGQALQLREALNEPAAAEATRRNLSLVTRPVSDSSTDAPTTPSVAVSDSSTQRATTPPVAVIDFDSLPLRNEIQVPAEARQGHRFGAALFILVLLLTAAGGFVYSVRVAPPWWPSWNLASVVARFESSVEEIFEREVSPPLPPLPTAVEASLEQPRDATVVSLDAESPRIRIFTARPGSMTRGGPTNLCFAVDGALQVRVEPDIGEVTPTDALTCVRVAPALTTTYELTARGGNGGQVSQQLVIVVR
jgi:hypothetical protein